MIRLPVPLLLTATNSSRSGAQQREVQTLSAADNAWTSLCWSPQRELLVAVSSSGTGNRIMTSSDGLSWTTRSSPADLGWRSLCWSPQRRKFAAVSNSGAGNRVMVSP